MTEVPAVLVSKNVTDVIDQIRPTFKSAPHLPKGVVDFLATIAPWFALIGGILGILGSLSYLAAGLGFSMSFWMTLTGFSTMYFLVMGVLQLAAAVIALLSFKPLQARQKSGWILMFWGMIVSILESIVGVVFGVPIGSLIGLVIGVLIGLYVMFEMEKSYH